MTQLERQRHLAGQSELACDQIYGEYACRDNRRLQIEQIDRRAEDPVAGQEEIEDRGEVNAEMRHQIGALEGGLGNAGYRHALIHLGKDTEVKGVVVEGAVFQRSEIAEYDRRDHKQRARGDQGDLAVDPDAGKPQLVVLNEPLDDDKVEDPDADRKENIADVRRRPCLLTAVIGGSGDDLTRRVIRRDQDRGGYRAEEQRPRDDVAAF